MTTPLDIITNALDSIGAHAPGEPVDSSLANQAFTMLNDLLDMESNTDFMVLSTSEVIAPIGGMGTDITIGPGGMINAARPLGINSAFVRVSNIDYPVACINVEQYELIGLKQLNGPWPRALYYNSGNPLGLIKFWPNPSQGEIHLFVNQVFTQFATLTDTVQFPQGYLMWLRWGLAELLMPAYGKTDPAMYEMVKKNAKRAVSAIKGTNMDPVQIVQFDAALGAGRRADAGFIMHGGFR